MGATSASGLPRGLEEIDVGFMTDLLRRRGVIGDDNEVVAMAESDVGMTAGYFSSIKRMECTFARATDAPTSYIAKCWPELELMPREEIERMFVHDIAGHRFPADRFFPRPTALLADFDREAGRFALVMEDAAATGVQKVHEHELDLDEVLRMIPGMVDMAVAWEGCDDGERGAELDELHVDHWASDHNLGVFRAVMASGAKLFDKVTTMEHSPLVGSPPWDQCFGPGIAELFTNKLDAFYVPVRPENGATCTLVHGDLRGDNIFFCEPGPGRPDGWLAIDFQQMFRGPVPSDLAYLMTSGSVLPDVYAGEGREVVMRAFYDRFVERTGRYPDYSWEQFCREYTTMTTILFIYFVGMGGAILRAGAFDNEQMMRVELGGRGVTEDDLEPSERRQRMWSRKAMRNFRETFSEIGLYAHLETLPDNTGPTGPWTELPDHLR